MKPNSSKFFAKAWQEWLDKAETDPTAQAKIDRVIKHPEFELYNLNEDPWELNNLAQKPGYNDKISEMHAQLQTEMERLKDAFSRVDPKDAKRVKKGRSEKTKRGELTQKPGLKDKQKRREAKKQARKKGEAEQAE